MFRSRSDASPPDLVPIPQTPLHSVYQRLYEIAGRGARLARLPPCRCEMVKKTPPIQAGRGPFSGEPSQTAVPVWSRRGNLIVGQLVIVGQVPERRLVRQPPAHASTDEDGRNRLANITAAVCELPECLFEAPNISNLNQVYSSQILLPERRAADKQSRKLCPPSRVGGPHVFR